MSSTMSLAGLSVLAHAQGFTLWLCRVHQIADARTPAFLGAKVGVLAPGDMVLVSATDGGQIFAVPSQPATTLIPLG